MVVTTQAIKALKLSRFRIRGFGCTSTPRHLIWFVIKGGLPLTCSLATSRKFGSIFSLWSREYAYGKIGNYWQLIGNVGKGEAMANAADEILTLDEVAAYLKAGKRTVYRLAAAKKIPAFKVGGAWRFSRADIDRWIKQQSMESLATGGDEDDTVDGQSNYGERK
jgi:excisionase family DNA binding protein